MGIADSRTHVEHVRGMFAAQKMADLRRYLQGIEASRQAVVKTEREKAAIDRGVTTDALRMDPAWFEIWREPGPILLQAIGPFRWISFPPQVRLLRIPEQFVPWHQDLAYQRVLGARGHRRLITCFVPVDEAPAQRTTLEFCASDEREWEHVPMARSEAGIPREFSAPWHYLLGPGDGLVFGDLAIHRTFLPEKAQLERRSMEFRLVRREDALDAKDYFDVDTGLIVRTDGSAKPWV